MAYRMVLILISLIYVQCSVLKSQGALKRVARSPSCHECDGAFPPPPPPPEFYPPPPPPPFQYRTQQWSGLARDSQGAPRGVYSGSAAALGNTKSSGQAFSIASAAASSGGGLDESQAQASGYQGSNRVGNFKGNEQQQVPLNGQGAFNSDNQSQGKSAAGQGSAFSSSQYKHQQRNGQSFDSQNGGQFNNGGSHSDEQLRGDLGQLQQSSTGNGFGSNVHGYNSQSSAQSQSFSNGGQVSRQAANDQRFNGQQQNTQSLHEHNNNLQSQSSGFDANNQQQQLSNQQLSQSGFGEENRNANLQNGAGFSSNDQQQQVRWNQGRDRSQQSQSDLQSTLSGAFNLAAQGLQTPCTTCGKGSLALSNASSHNGDAVALSVGG